MNTDEDPSEAQVRCATRLEIVRLILSTLDHPAPNMAHFLLGFELRKPVAKTNLQDPGTLSWWFKNQFIDKLHFPAHSNTNYS